MIYRILSLAFAMLCCAIAFGQTKPSSEDGPWHKIKSADGHTKTRPVMVKFQPGTQRFRVTIKSTADKDERDRPHPSANIRVTLQQETQRSVEDKPVNWQQTDIIYHGKTGTTQTRAYSNGLDKDGKPKWFQVVITGYVSEYEVTIEDQSADDSAKGSKAKSKKKKEKDDGDPGDPGDRGDKDADKDRDR